MSDYKGYYERLQAEEALDGKSVEEWLKSVKNSGDGVVPEVTEKEKRKVRQLREEEVSRNINRSEGVGEEFVEENTFHRDGEEFLELKTEQGTKKYPASKVSNVTFARGAVRVQGEDGQFYEGRLEL